MNKITTLVLTSLASLTVNAQTWIDVTDTYVKNPRYDNNDYSFWEGTPLSGNGPKENAEHYEKNYDTYQTITGLPAGKYRVSLNAFYRIGNSSTDYSTYNSANYTNSQYARLYATSSEGSYDVGIASASSAALETALSGAVSGVGRQTGGSWWNPTYEYWIPNNMDAANSWFSAGYYLNRVECQVGSDGILTIGIRKTTTVNEDWTCLDNWQLEHYDFVKEIESITFNESSIDIVLGGQVLVKPIITPSDATFQTVAWTIKDTKIATVSSDGTVTAVGVGKTVLTATAKDGSGVKGTIDINVFKNEPSSENIVINEIMAANADVYLDPNMNYGSWVELYNPTSKGVNIGGLYVSDDATNLKKHKLTSNYGSIPAHGYAILNFDHHEIWTENAYRQIDDKLDCDGGTIIISDGTNIIAQQEYPAVTGARISYARTTDGGSTWGNAGNPTPGASNADGMFATEQIEAPVVDKNGQLFNGTMQICVNIPDGATLKYTTDGTAPTLTNGEVSETGLFTIDETTTFRFRLFKNDYLPSKVVTRSYIENNGNEPFPIISVVTDPDNIYSKERGAFMSGPNGRPGNGRTDKCNWNMAWDHPVNFEYITTDNECVVSQECDFSMCGGWSRAWTPHAFKLKANKVYDFENTFNYQFFSEKPNLKHKTLQIRNGGNDNNCRIKDAALQGVVGSSGLYVDHQAWQPVHVYINGESYAVLNMREPNNKHYAYANYGIDTDEMEQFEMSPDSGYVQMQGTGEYFEKLCELSEDAEDADTYDQISKLMDIDEYINYMAIELYLGNWDWPQNNVKGFRDLNDGKFHFVLFDLDGSLSTDTPFETFFQKLYYQFDTLHGFDYSNNQNVEGQRLIKEIKFVQLFRNMLTNADFRKRFIDAYCIVNGSVFTPDRVSETINKMSSYLSTGYYVFPSSTANELINKFTTARQTALIAQLKNTEDMQLSSVSGQKANLSSNIEGAQISINGQTIPTGKLSGTLFAPITLKATAPAGYKFLGWKGVSNKINVTTFTTSTSWKYYDKGSLDEEDWTSSSFNDSGWPSGTTPIGYGKTQKTTTSKNLPTYYFRKNVIMNAAPQAGESFTLTYTIDDGMVVYVNGVEAGRYNMPSGKVNYNTLATTYAHDNPDTGELEIDASLFHKGTNVIAVEVHNNDATSSDILWSAMLTYHKEQSSVIGYVSYDAEYTCNSEGNIELVAMWQKMTDEEMIAQGINASPVVINEVSASNSVFVNDYFKKNDWIELYNTTDKDVDIAGLYISDNVKKPAKYQIPANDVTLNTVIPANGYKVIWCDKLDNTPQALHTSFKLGAEGGDIMIAMGKADATSDDITAGENIAYSDTITYITHNGQQAFGRFPDNGASTYVLDIPTPGKANILTSYATEYVAPEPEPEPDAITITRDGGMTIAFIDGVVNIKSEDAAITLAAVYAASGAKQAVNTTRSTNSYVTLNVSSLPTGIYIAKAVNADGNECQIKFVIK